MRAEYVNSFIGAARSVIQDLCNTEAKLGKVYIRQAPLSVANVVIMVGVVGEVVGQVYLSYQPAQPSRWHLLCLEVCR